MSKFKVGDFVECMGKKRGSGWKLGHQFKVTSITAHTTSTPIYWKGIENCGVYEESLKLVRSKDEVIYM